MGRLGCRALPTGSFTAAWVIWCTFYGLAYFIAKHVQFVSLYTMNIYHIIVSDFMTTDALPEQNYQETPKETPTFEDPRSSH